MPIAGELACLATALLWAVAVTLFRRPVVEHGARTVNLAKCLLGAVLQGLTVLLLEQSGSLATVSLETLHLLAASGLIGLTIGDTALFGAVSRIGVHRTLLLQTLSPVFAALVALIWRDELPSGLETLGALVILSGVALVVGTDRDEPADDPPRHSVISPRLAGVLLGVLAAFGQGAGLVLAKTGMAELPVIPASFVRLAAGAAGLVVLAGVQRRAGRFRGLLAAPVMLSRVLPATLLGTYLALFLMMLGVALAPAAVAATLLSVSPVYGLLIERLVHRRPLTAAGIAGTVLAVAGVAILAAG